MAGEIERNRVGNWTDQAISKLNPGSGGINFVISGPVSSSLSEEYTEVDIEAAESKDLYLVGVGLRKDSGYAEAMMTCKEIWIPFEIAGSDTVERLKFKVDYRTSYPSWIYAWTNRENAQIVSRSYVPVQFSGSGIYTEYGSAPADLDYDVEINGPGGILFIPYVHPNYLTTDDYNGILGNVMETTETEHLYTILKNDENDPKLKKKIGNSLRYKNYLEDYHKYNAVGSLHAGEIEIPNGNLSRCEEQGEYFKSYANRAKELTASGSLTLQTLDFPYMSYRAISASVYVDRYTEWNESGSEIPVKLESVWEDMQGGNTDDPETVFFVGTASREQTNIDDYPLAADGSPYIEPGIRTSVPVTGSILFRMDGHLAVRVTRATVYAPFLNTVYRTGEYGEVLDLFTSGSAV